VAVVATPLAVLRPFLRTDWNGPNEGSDREGGGHRPLAERHGPPPSSTAHRAQQARGSRRQPANMRLRTNTDAPKRDSRREASPCGPPLGPRWPPRFENPARRVYSRYAIPLSGEKKISGLIRQVLMYKVPIRLP